jgi:hypothetical protein
MDTKFNPISLESLLYDSSRRVIEIAVKVIEEHPEQLKAMFELCCKPYPISMRAARVMQLYFEKHQEIIPSFLNIISNELLITKVDGVKRSFLKILSFLNGITTIENATLILDKCLECLRTDKESIAVRAYSIDLLIKFAIEEPELRNEILLAFEIIPMDDYPSLKYRCRNGIKIIRNDLK